MAATKLGSNSHGARPWWTRVLPFIRRPAGVTPHQQRILGVLGAANLIDGYDQAILGLALTQIQDGLGIAESEVGALISIVRLGVLLALVLTALADGMGRRRLVLVTIIGFTVATFLTAFARTPAQFAICQFVARIFVAAESMLAIVIIAEEFDASTRGWGIGVFGALGALGHGLAAMMFSFVNLLPFGWRMLYVLGVIPLLTIAWFRRSLKETRRFTDYKEKNPGGSSLVDVMRPFRHLFRMYPGRLLALCAALFPLAFAMETATIFVPKTLQDVHGYTPGQVALLFFTAGITAPLGSVIAGTMGDRFGRKRIMIVGSIVNAGATALFYNTAGWWIPPLWSLMLLSLTMTLTLFAAVGSELFPTSYRSTASGVRAVVSTLGAALGLFAEGFLYNLTGSHAAAITWMLLATPLGPVIVGLFVPETANQELEEIAPER